MPGQGMPARQTAICVYIQPHNIAPIAQAQLRLAQIFKAVVAVAYDDMFDHPWKIPFYTMPLFGIGTAIMMATVAMHCIGQSDKSRQFRAHIAHAFNRAVRYQDYKDCMYINQNGAIRVNTKDLATHCTKWLYNRLSSKVRERVYGMEKSRCKAFMYKNIIKRLPAPMPL